MGFEPGGIANKLGNRYEDRWVVKQLLNLLAEKLRSVKIETIGDDEEGVDLWVETIDGDVQAQQCKARNGQKESWPISDLRYRGVISKSYRQLNRNKDITFSFISGIPATQIGDLCESARNFPDDPEAFYIQYTQRVGKDKQDLFLRYFKAVNADPNDEGDRAKIHNCLRRFYAILFPYDYNALEDVLYSVSFLLTGDPKIGYAALLAFAELEDKLRVPIHSDELWKYLTDKGIHPKRLEHDDRITPVINELKEQFSESIQQGLIDGQLTYREKVKSIIDSVNTGVDVLLHGTAGCGKSAIIYSLAKYLEKNSIPYIPIRLDRRVPRNTASQFGCDMGLPDSPAYCLAAHSGMRRSVLILDQLDSIRWTDVNSANALDVCKELVRQVQQLRRDGKKISVVLSCRSFDLEHDPEMRNWLANQDKNKISKINLTGFTQDEMQLIIGPSYDKMGEKEKRILSCPQNLAIWKKLVIDGVPPKFHSATSLMKLFWIHSRKSLEKAGIALKDWDDLQKALLDYLEKFRKIIAPKRICQKWPRVTEALCSNGIIQEIPEGVAFVHQSYLDYLIAENLIEQIYDGDRGIIDWLGSKGNQTLLRRDQLRLVLSLIYEDSSTELLKAAKDILESEAVRFHLKHLVLEIIGQIEHFADEIGDYCFDLFQQEYWEGHILDTVYYGNPQSITYLHAKGILSEWLNSEEDIITNRALRLLGSVASIIPDKVAEILVPYSSKGEEWQNKIINTIGWEPSSDSNRMFDFRLKLARLGTYSSFIDWSKLCDRFPLRAIKLIEAVLSTMNIDKNTSSSRRKRNRMEQWYDRDHKALLKATEEHPEFTWDSFMPHIERLTSHLDADDIVDLSVWRNNRFYIPAGNPFEIECGVVELAIHAGQTIAKQQPDIFFEKTKPIEDNPSPIIQEILIRVYESLPPSHADNGIEWLLDDLLRLRLGSGYNETEWEPARRLITALSPHCSEHLFRILEDAIIHHFTTEDIEGAKRVIPYRREGHYYDYWGRTQYHLLPALCSSRRLQSTNNLMEVLNRKYARYPREAFLKSGRISGGSVGSTLDSSLSKISDRTWLDIICNDDIPDRDGQWKQVDDDHVIESTKWQFSRSLELIAKRFPERFGKLGLRLPQDTNPYYISAILRALGMKKLDQEVPAEEKDSWAPASIETIEAFLERFQSYDDNETAEAFCRLISERAKEPWSDLTIQRLVRYAKEHPDPEAGKLHMHCDKTSDESTVDILFQNTINCVRGVAARAIGRLLQENNTLIDKLQPAIEALVCDPHPVVRMAAIEALYYLLYINKDLAVKLFCQACNGDLRVACSPMAIYFFNNTMKSHYNDLKPIVIGMMRSSNEEVALAGAKEVAARWIFFDFFADELKECINGSVPQRRGVACIASELLYRDDCMEKSQVLLFELLDDPCIDVRKEMSSIFRNEKVIDILRDGKFTQQYIRSKTFSDDPECFVYALKDYPGSLIPLSDSLFTIFDVFALTLREKARDTRTTIPLAFSKVVNVLLRLYDQALASRSDIVTKCLDIWDMMYENRIGLVRELTKAIENSKT